ncbi:MAG: hypothetical protein KKB25_01160, partial [Nanoarchaeota archaeon]|nr:hypothetical protein [Nanoarchaeota archaeon]
TGVHWLKGMSQIYIPLWMNVLMEIKNYLMELLDNNDDASIRVSGIYEDFKAMWQSLENKNKFRKNIEIKKSTIDNYLKRKEFVPISLLYRIAKEYCKQNKTDFNSKWNELYRKVTYFKSMSSGSRKIRLPKRLTPELAYIAGALRDGCLATYSKNENHFGVVFTQESCVEWFIETLIPMINKIFSIKPKAGKNMQIYNKPLFKFFQKVLEHPPGNQTKWNTPKIIKKAPRQVQLKYMQGFFDAEGLAPKKSNYIGFTQNNRESLQFIKSFLEKNKIRCGSIRRSRNTYVFVISNFNGIKRFIELVGTSHPERKKNLERIYSFVNSKLAHS